MNLSLVMCIIWSIRAQWMTKVVPDIKTLESFDDTFTCWWYFHSVKSFDDTLTCVPLHCFTASTTVSSPLWIVALSRSVSCLVLSLHPPPPPRSPAFVLLAAKNQPQDLLEPPTQLWAWLWLYLEGSTRCWQAWWSIWWALDSHWRAHWRAHSRNIHLGSAWAASVRFKLLHLI